MNTYEVCLFKRIGIWGGWMMVGDGGLIGGVRAETSEAAGRVARDWHVGVDLTILVQMGGYHGIIY